MIVTENIIAKATARAEIEGAKRFRDEAREAVAKRNSRKD